ncbi:MAG: hypothetical protein P4M15_13665 [Alphaproteobacteria bacterium]|nr:hypothetical protein [Alphaproteobacteria bacterium]
MKKIILALIAILWMQGAAFAAGAPDPASNPVLSNIQKSGAKLYPLGNRNGLDGWFIVKNGQVQIAYATPDNKGVLVGALFGQDGENLTTLQVSTLMRDNKEVADLLAAAQKEQIAINEAGQSAAASATPAIAAKGPGGLPSEPLSPGVRLLNDLSTSATVMVAKDTNSPEILMVMDPHCPHCQDTWKALRDAVLAGKLHIRMVPIGAQGSDNERAAAMFLGAADPLTVWDQYVAGNHGLLGGAPPDEALAAVRANHAVIDNWHIDATPYLVYRAHDGTVKVVVGEPGKMAAVFADLGVK